MPRGAGRRGGGLRAGLAREGGGAARRTFEGEEGRPCARGEEAELLAPPPAPGCGAEADGGPGLLEEARVVEPVGDAEVRREGCLGGSQRVFVVTEAPLERNVRLDTFDFWRGLTLMKLNISADRPKLRPVHSLQQS